MRPVLHCDLLWQARSSAERVNGKMQESNPLLSWVVWKERRDWWKESKGGGCVCKRPAALTFLWIKHKVFSVLPRRPHLLILHGLCAAHIWNKMPRLLDMLTWTCFMRSTESLTGGCLPLYFSVLSVRMILNFPSFFSHYLKLFSLSVWSLVFLHNAARKKCRISFRMILLYSKSGNLKSARSGSGEKCY